MCSNVIASILVIILISFVPLQAGWEPCSSGTTVSLYGVVCANIVGQPELVYVVGDSGTILKSTDYGDTWIPCNSGTSVMLRDVCFIEGSANIAFVVGDGAALRTTDYGASWHSMNVPSAVDLRAVAASLGPDQHVFIVNNTNQVFKSTDCGDTWTTLTLQTGLQLGDIITYNGFHAEAVSSTGYVAKTRDGGSSWLYDPFTNVSLLSITEATRYRWWVGGYYAGTTNSPRVYITEDSGSTYTQVYDGIAGEMVTGVTTAGQDYCFACGMVSGNSDSSGFILRFNNYGQSCIEQVTGYPLDFYNIDNYGRYYAWVVGEQGLILRTTDGGGEGVIRVTVPNGGEYWERGNSYDITWLSDNVPGNVMIELYKGSNPYDTIAYDIPNTHQYNYYVPFSLPQADDYKVKITSMDNPQICDISDDYFMIGSGVNITVTYPNGGEFLKTRDTCYITWESNGITGNIRIWLYWDGGSQYIESDTLNSGIYPWYIPSHQQRDTTYKIRVQSIDYPTVDDYSDDYFSIGKQIAVIHPTTGDTLYAGEDYEILWDSAGIGGYVSIEYSTDGGWEWDTVVASTVDDGSYIWQNIPNTPTEVGRVLIKHLSYNNTNNAQSDGFFTIIGEPCKNWTIFVYMNADHHIGEDWLITDFNEMEAQIDTSIFNVIVRIDRHPDGDTSNGNWTGTRDYRVVPDSQPDNIIRSILLHENGELNMGDDSTFIDFIRQYYLDYPANHYGVIIMGHGDGWRDQNPGIDKICEDETDGGVIWLSLDDNEFQRMLDSVTVFLGPIDILVLHACLMGMHEVACEAQNYVDYLVFSEALFTGFGYPYDSIFNWLSMNGNATPVQLANTVVYEFLEFLQNMMTLSGTNSVVSVDDSYNILSEKINTFAQELINAGGKINLSIQSARNNSQNYYWGLIGAGDSTHIDLYDFAQRIKNIPTLPITLRNAADSVMAATELMVKANIYYSGIPGNVDNSHGIAIYYPKDDPQSIYTQLKFTEQYPCWYNFISGQVSMNENQAVNFSDEFRFTSYPNPATKNVDITFAIPKVSNVAISIYDCIGRLVCRLCDDEYEAGIYSIYWNCTSDTGSKLSDGVYFIKVNANDYEKTEKIILLR